MQFYRFGNFDLDSQNHELRKDGVPVRLPPQPLALLQLLVENAGELVTRDQIQRQVWGGQRFLDFDRNLNVCMTQIRAALNDDAEAPRFIRTVPKHGYTFLAPVENGRLKVRKPRPYVLIAAVVCVIAVSGFFAFRRIVDNPTGGRVMLAVLPFEGGEESISDGLTEELIGNLGSIHSGRLGVIGRGSVMRFKGSRRALNDIARELNVQYLLEGTVRRDAGRVRVTARLVKASDQALVWTEAYEEDDVNAFRMEQDAAAHITAAVTWHLFPQAAPPSFRIVDRDAYEAYRTGRSLQFQGTRAALERGILKLEEATRLNPRYADAYAALADACVSMARSGSPPKEWFPRAAAAAARAVEFEESNAEAHNALANVRFWYDWNWTGAEQQFTRALQINPSLATAHHDYAWLLVATGRTEAGLASLRRAIAFDPLSVRINMDAGWLLLQAHRYDQSIQQARRALELQPGLQEASFCIKRALQYQNNTKIEQPPGASPYNQAVYSASMRDSENALRALRQAFEERSVMIPLLNVDPAFTWLHADPRFQQLVAKIK